MNANNPASKRYPHRGPACRRTALAIAVSGLISGQAGANPQGGQVVQGNATMNTNGGTLTITNSHGTIINWDSFSIAEDEITRFIQQGEISAILNRVTGGDPSSILGQLLSNGRVFLINPNGVVFGKGSVVDTAGLVVSSLDISNEDFNAGRLAFSGDGGKVENRGYIRVGRGGEVMLLASSVENSGVIQANDGRVLLAAGRDILIESLDLEHVRFRLQAPEHEVLNLGRIITTNGVTALFAGTLKHAGSIEANSISRGADGVIRLHGSHRTDVSGSLSADSGSGSGGDITITGDAINLAGADVSADGVSGGGHIRIGGDYQGGGELNTARTTRLDQNTTLSADALQHGDGGRIIVWADDHTETAAAISARGGAASGDGGFVETSGKKTLDARGSVDVSAANGAGGTWLLDPENITIGPDQAEAFSETLSSGGSVIVKTSDDGDEEGNITVAAAITKSGGNDSSLSLDAHNRIDVNASITSTEGELDVNLKAGDSIHVNAPVDTNGGNFSQVVVTLETDIPTGDTLPPTETTPDEAEPDESSPDTVVSEDESDADDESAGSVTTAVVTDDPPPSESAEDPAQDVVIEELDNFKASLDILVDAEINTDGGDIHIDGGATGDVGIFENVDASSETGAGGNINILGRRVGAFEDAQINASGASGGGEVNFGGGQQGQDPNFRNATITQVGEDATIRADATDNGDGGRIIVYSDDTTHVAGELSARGGANGGNGGFIETSGRIGLSVDQTPDTGAEHGAAGTWLIDPANVRITGNESVYTLSGIGGSPNFIPTLDTATIGAGLIRVALQNGTNVQVHTTHGGASEGNITWDADLDMDGLYADYGGPGGSGTLGLYADNDITFEGSIHDSDTYTFDDRITGLNLDAGGAIRILGNNGATLIDINGNLVANGSSLNIEGGDATGDSVTINIEGDNDLIVDVDGDILIRGGSAANTGVDIDAGSISFSGNNASIEGGAPGAGLSGASADVYSTSNNTLSLDLDGDFTLSGGASGYGNRGYLQARNVDVQDLNDFNVLGGGGEGNNAAYARLGNVSGSMTGDLNILGGDAGNDNAAVMRVNAFFNNSDFTLNGMRNINVEGGDAGKDNYARLRGSSAELTTSALGNVSVLGGAAGENNFAEISFGDDVTLQAVGNINVIGGGGSGNYAELRSSDNLFANSSSGNINISGGESGTNNDAFVGTNDDYVYLYAGNDVNVVGGTGGTDNYARVYGKYVGIDAGRNVNITGGGSSDTDNFARISGKYYVDIRSVGNTSITGGIGDGAFATVDVNMYEGYDFEGLPHVNILAGENIRVHGGSGFESQAGIYGSSITLNAGDDLSVRGDGEYSFGVVLGRYRVQATADNIIVEGGDQDDAGAGIYTFGEYFYTDTTTRLELTARSGDINVLGGAGNFSSAFVGNYSGFFGYYTDTFSGGVQQSINASGNINVYAGSGYMASGGIGLFQYFVTDGEYAGDNVDTTLFANQSITAGANLNIVGGTGASAVSGIYFAQSANFADTNGTETWNLDFTGSQTVSAGNHINIVGGYSADRPAFIELGIHVDVDDYGGIIIEGEGFGALDVDTLNLGIDTSQNVNAGDGGLGGLYIIANQGNAYVRTGNDYITFSSYTSHYTTDQTISADNLRIVATEYGGVAELRLDDADNASSNLQTINVSGNTTIHSTSGGIARIVNEGNDSSVSIGGTFTFTGNDSAVQLNNGTAGAAGQFNVTDTNLNDSPDFDFGSGGTFNVSNRTTLNGNPDFIGPGVVNLTHLYGPGGEIRADEVVIDGIISIGNSPGTVTFSNNLTLTASANPQMEIQGSPASGLYDQIFVGNTANLAGSMTIFLSDYTPTGGEQYDLISAPSVTGGFSTFNGAGFTEGQSPTLYFVTFTGFPDNTGGSSGSPNQTTEPPFIPPDEPPIPPFDPIDWIISLLDQPDPDAPDDPEFPKRPVIGLCTAKNS